MKERPILFSSPMVRAILECRKTQTRRVVKPQPVSVNSCGVPFFPDGGGPVDYRLCPYGTVGSRLWVRETWAPTSVKDNCVYLADFRDRRGDYWGSVASAPEDVRWRPSIHMPRFASRITLEITGVRVERLQEISEDDARSEGWHPEDGQGPCEWYEDLWNTIHGPDSWSANPWVWVIEFRRIKL